MAEYRDIKKDREFMEQGGKARKSFNPKLKSRPIAPDDGMDPNDPNKTFDPVRDYIPGPSEEQPSDEDLLSMAQGNSAIQPQSANSASPSSMDGGQAPAANGLMGKMKKKMPPKKQAEPEDVW